MAQKAVLVIGNLVLEDMELSAVLDWTKSHRDAGQLCWGDTASSLLPGTYQHRDPSQGGPVLLNRTRGRLSPKTRGSVNRHTHQPMPIPSPDAPPQAEEGEIASTAWAPLHPESCAWSLSHWQHAALSLSLGALSVGLIHPLLCNVTSLPWFLHASKVPRLQQCWNRERKKRFKGKKVLFQVKDFCLMYCII